MQTFWQDLRYALRLFARQPGFAAAAVLSLGIGIGANTALFSVTNALLLSPLPYDDADRLAILWNRSPGLDITEDWFSTAQYFDIRTGSTSFETLAIALGSNMNLTDDESQPQRVGVIRVSANLLPMLGARATQGRLLVAEDDVAGRALTAVLSHGTWLRRYGGDPNIVGRTIRLNGQVIEIVGVLPQDFSLPHEVLPTLGMADDGEIFLPLPMQAGAAEFRGREDYNIIGKLKQGVSVPQAQAEMDRLTARLRHDFPANYPPNGGLTFSVVPLLEQVVGNVRRALLILVGAVGFVLLIACANVANLLLSRAATRQREITVRSALGATRARITRQLLTESLLLALAGGVLGLLLALLGVAWIQALQPLNVPRLNDIGITFDVLLFTTLLSFGSALLFGMAPASGIGKLDLQAALKDAGRGSIGSHALWGRGSRLRRLLVMGELALSVVLLIGAGLLIKSFTRLQDVPPGFNAAGVLTFELSLAGPKYPNGPAVLNAYQQLWQRLDNLPGVEQSGGITSLPLSGYMAWGPITIEGYTPPGGEDFINADQRIAAGKYFEALQVPLRSGRFFSDADRADGARVVIIDEFLARQYWPGQDAVGKRLRLGPISANSDNWLTVVGVVGRVKQYGLDSDGRIVIYLPHTQFNSRSMYVTIRAQGPPTAIAAAVRRELHALDPDLPMYRTRTMDERLDAALARPRFAMTLLTIFAAFALALAAIGIYGVMAYLVSQGTRDIGIRIALGATQRSVLAMVLRQGTLIAADGLTTGLLGAWALTRFMQALLFGVSDTDGLTFAAVTAVLAAVALAATFIPAHRAARIDPVVALRE
ncbi:MAG: ABC transporter permease [Longimicrobiales bacterium]